MLPKEDREKEPKGVRELLDLVRIDGVDPKADAESRHTSAVEANVRNSARMIRDLDPKAEGFELRDTDLLVRVALTCSGPAACFASEA